MRGGKPQSSRRGEKQAVEVGIRPAFVPLVTTTCGLSVRHASRWARHRCSTVQEAGSRGTAWPASRAGQCGPAGRCRRSSASASPSWRRHAAEWACPIGDRPQPLGLLCAGDRCVALMLSRREVLAQPAGTGRPCGAHRGETTPPPNPPRRPAHPQVGKPTPAQIHGPTTAGHKMADDSAGLRATVVAACGRGTHIEIPQTRAIIQRTHRRSRPVGLRVPRPEPARPRCIPTVNLIETAGV